MQQKGEKRARKKKMNEVGEYPTIWSQPMVGNVTAHNSHGKKKEMDR